MKNLQQIQSFFSISAKMGLLFAVAISFAVSTVLIPANVNATSVYDDVIRVVDDLEITDSSGGNAHDFKLDWASEMIDVLDQRCTALGGTDCSRLALLEAMATPTGQWAVARSGDPTYQTYLHVYFSSNETGTADFSLSGGIPTFFLRSTSTQVSYTFYINPSATYKTANNLAFLGANDNGTTSAIPFQESDYDAYFLFINYPITYPSGYEGTIPPTGVEPPETTHGIGYKPSFDYTVTDQDLEVLDVTNPDLISQFTIDLCLFQLPNNKYGDNFTEYEYDCDTPVPVDHTFSDGNADYNIILRHYSSTDNLWYENSRVLHVDGSTFSGGVGSDSTNSAINNALNSFAFPLFGLQEIFLMPINFIATLPSKVDACEPISLPLMDTTYEMDCLLPYYQLEFGTIVTIYQTVFTGLTTYFIAMNVLARIKSTTNPKDDSIEVVHL